MAKAAHSGKLLVFIIVALIGGAAGYGYFAQSSKLEEKPKTEETQVVERAALRAKPNDIILGDVNAMVTIVEYASLSCPGCANFHEKVLPEIEKEFITTGKAKLIFRHFPLNAPAMTAAQVVECADRNKLKRENFLKVLFSMQQQWAFSESYVEDIRKIALVGGMDDEAIDSCLADKEMETALLNTRKEAEEDLGVESTPTLFINGAKYTGEMTVEGVRSALEAAAKPLE
jgi:protein-disulfide isomerase